MPPLRDFGSLDQYSYLAGLGLDQDDASRLDVATGTAEHAGFYVNAESGDARLFTEGETIPTGVWIAQREIDAIHPNAGQREEPHGYGEGWGDQGDQLGGDRSYPEEDAGGTRRVPHGAAEGTSADPTASDSKSANETEASLEPPR